MTENEIREEKKGQSGKQLGGGVRMASKNENNHITGFLNKTLKESHECNDNGDVTLLDPLKLLNNSAF